MSSQEEFHLSSSLGPNVSSMIHPMPMDLTPPSSPPSPSQILQSLLKKRPRVTRTHSIHQDLNLAMLEEFPVSPAKKSYLTRNLRHFPLREAARDMDLSSPPSSQEAELLSQSDTLPLDQSMEMNQQIQPIPWSPEREEDTLSLPEDFTMSVSPVESEKSKFRFRSLSLFCTYPQCATAKEVAMKNIVSRWGENVEYAVVAEEKHKDGKPHLHVLIKFRNQISSCNAKFADFISGSHGNYKPAKPMWKAYNYTVKAGCFVVHGVVPQTILSQASKKLDSKSNSGAVTTEEVALAMVGGASVKDIYQKYPGKFLMYRSRIESFKEYQNVVERTATRTFPGFKPVDPDLDPFLFELVGWLQDNLVDPIANKKSRPFKTPQLYLHGPPSSGKTSMILELMKFFRVYFLPMDEEFYDEYEDGLYDLVVLEEFASQKTITWLNSFLEGAPKTIRKKQRQYLKTKNIPVIILSNLSPDECYINVAEKHPSQFEAFKIRLQVLEVPLFSEPTDVDVIGADYIPGITRRARHVKNVGKYFISLPIVDDPVEEENMSVS